MTQADPLTPASTNRRLASGLALAAAVCVAAGLVASVIHAPAPLGLGLRCAAIALLIPFALRRRSLLVWTFFAMLAGAELGVDAPALAAQTHFLSDIFLRLIRMIVAPLIFGGIVTGIAGHNELRSV
ncbi:MAG: cation:dicarboxylase symporter family transporter, partial [Terracidiphilus sp.]